MVLMQTALQAYRLLIWPMALPLYKLCRCNTFSKYQQANYQQAHLILIQQNDIQLCISFQEHRT